MKNLKTRLRACTFAILSLAASAALAQTLSDDKVRIGVLTDMSGPYSETGGKGSVIAAQMAIDDFGGKVLGKPIELVSGDHQNKPDVGVTLAKSWYERDAVDAIFDINNSTIALAVNKLATENKRVVINTGAGSLALTNESCAPTAIHYTYDTYSLANGSAMGVAAQGGKSWYIIAVDYAFGKQISADLKSFVDQSHGKVIGSVAHPLNTADFSSFLLQAQASNADTIALANAGADAINAIKTAQQFGITRKQRLVPLLMTIIDVHALGLNDAQGLVFTEAFYWNRDKATREWSRRFFEKAKKMPSLVHAGTYSAVTQYLNAIKAVGSDDASAVTTRMKATPINDMFATNGHIRADGRMVHDMYLVEVKKPSESKEPWDYYRVLQTIPGDKAFQPMEKGKCPLVKS